MRERTRAYETVPRLIDVKDLCLYIGMGRTRAVEFARGAGAEKRIGRRCLYDVKIIDQAIDQLQNTQ